MTPCPLCAAHTVREYADAVLEVDVCSSCGHRQAKHATTAVGDYYEHTPQAAAFLAALETTRRRQAKALLARVEGLVPQGAPWLDFGCGRGWFLDEAQRAGRSALLGFDTSAKARDWLTTRGVAAPPPSEREPLWPNLSSLTAQPEVVSLLDVVEHFEEPAAPVRRLLHELPSLRWVVVKVPVSDGALFRVARALRSLAPGPYRQLFQVGTQPPHQHYFSSASLRRWATSTLGLRVALRWTDPDVDDLFGRVAALAGLPGGRLAGRALGRLPHDSEVLVLERVSPP